MTKKKTAKTDNLVGQPLPIDNFKNLENIQAKTVNNKELEAKLKEYKREVIKTTINAIRNITYISFVIGIGLSLVTTVVIGIKAEDWKGKGEIIGLVFAIILAITLAFGLMTLFTWCMYIKNSPLQRNKYEIELQKLKDQERLREFKERLREKKEEIPEIRK